MTALDFPANPAVDDIFEQWKWDGVAWVSSTGAPPVFVGASPPLDPEPGWLWWASDIGRLFVWYVDDTSAQWVATSVGGGGGLSEDEVNELIADALLAYPAPNTIATQSWVTDQLSSLQQNLSLVSFALYIPGQPPANTTYRIITGFNVRITVGWPLAQSKSDLMLPSGQIDFTIDAYNAFNQLLAHLGVASFPTGSPVPSQVFGTNAQNAAQMLMGSYFLVTTPADTTGLNNVSITIVAQRM